MPKTTITVETESLTIVRRARVASGWCPQCHADVAAACVHEASWPVADAARVSQWADGVGVHRWRGADGSTWLCAQSLAQQLGADALRGLLGHAPTASDSNDSAP